MTRWHWLAASALIVVFAVALAPARLATQFVNESTANGGQLRLLQPSGTVWSGSADLLVNAAPSGRVAWRFLPTTLFRLAVGLRFDLTAKDFSAEGRLLKPFSGQPEIHNLNAQVDQIALQRWLARYDIVPSGTLVIEDLDLTELAFGDNGAVTALSSSGAANWSGGNLSYRLSGRTTAVILPPLVASISTEESLPNLRVTEKGKNLPLILARLTNRGSTAIGITQGFTRLAGQPWPGSEPDHKVVLEVEEMLH